MENTIKIVRLQANNVFLFTELVALFNEVFDEYHTVGSKKQLEKLLSQSSFHAVVAIKDDIIIGGLTAYELERYYSDRSELYIYDIAVQKEWQHQGIGKALINFLKKYSNDNETECIFVQAHTEDTDAVRFYESTIGTGEKVHHFTIEI